ncbi:hypothetical protein NDU88_005767 [Pleurodeles waltl]|uniref:Uncharacterized protein n=1 Tax=Pleurodeles waltl TaxID=8319 RepID=A0AAV7X279_PLEWA|nr:hypothetical protein NDU88_005767 [Pleurodeles waltl]
MLILVELGSVEEKKKNFRAKFQQQCHIADAFSIRRGGEQDHGHFWATPGTLLGQESNLSRPLKSAVWVPVVAAVASVAVVGSRKQVEAAGPLGADRRPDQRPLSQAELSRGAAATSGYDSRPRCWLGVTTEEDRCCQTVSRRSSRAPELLEPLEFLEGDPRIDCLWIAAAATALGIMLLAVVTVATAVEGIR